MIATSAATLPKELRHLPLLWFTVFQSPHSSNTPRIFRAIRHRVHLRPKISLLPRLVCPFFDSNIRDPRVRSYLGKFERNQHPVLTEWEGVARECRRTGASPGALPSVWPAALDAPSPCSVDGLVRRMWMYEGKRGSSYSQLVASGISRWRQSRQGSWSEALC